MTFVCHYRSLTRFAVIGLLMVSVAGCRTLAGTSEWFVMSPSEENVAQDGETGGTSETEPTEDLSVTLAFQQLAAVRQQQLTSGVGSIAKVSHSGNMPIGQTQATTTMPGVGGWSPMADIP